MNQDMENLFDIPKMNIPHRILLGPGPSMVDPRVLDVMSNPLVGHLDPSFLDLMDKIQVMLRYVYQTKNQYTFPVPGTGTAAMEAAVANIVEPDDPVLVCVNGFFGARLVDMVNRYGGKVDVIKRPWGEIFTPDEVNDALHRKAAKAVVIVHAETSTGTLQPLDEIVDVVHHHEAIAIVDAVTSLGGIPVRVDEIGIDVCYSGSQKCLSCPPGASPITLSPRALDTIIQRYSRIKNWYLDLELLGKYWGKERIYHHTAPISTIYALYEGLRIMVEEGLEKRWERHFSNAQTLWSGLDALGLDFHVPETYRLPSLTTVRIPSGVNDQKLRKTLLQEHNIEIGGGLGELTGKVWRIGLMGYSSRKENIETLLKVFKILLKNK